MPRRREKIKIKLYILTLVGGKNKKKLEVTFYSKNKQIQLELMQFLEKNPLIFGHVGGGGEIKE